MAKREAMGAIFVIFCWGQVPIGRPRAPVFPLLALPREEAADNIGS